MHAVRADRTLDVACTPRDIADSLLNVGTLWRELVRGIERRERQHRIARVGVRRGGEH